MDLIGSNAAGNYDPATPFELTNGQNTCMTPIGVDVGDNDYFILQFTSKDIYGMYDDDDDSNGDGKKDFMRAFFANNCDEPSVFTWDIGFATQAEFTDVGMVFSGMKIINYKEDVTFYSDDFQCPLATCPDGSEDLGFTYSWLDRDCGDPVCCGFPSMDDCSDDGRCNYCNSRRSCRS